MMVIVNELLSTYFINHCAAFYLEYPRTFIAFIFFIVFAIYYFREVAQKPRFYCKDGKFRWFILANCTMLHERYWPTFWCFGSHAQTVLANTIRARVPMPKYKREYIKMSDGGIVSLDWFDPVGNQKIVEQNREVLKEVLPSHYFVSACSQCTPQSQVHCSLKGGSTKTSSASGKASLNSDASFQKGNGAIPNGFSQPNCSSEDEADDQPIALFLPGLTGDSSTEYIKTLLPHACAMGYRVCVFNNRGRGGMPLKTPRMYCAANYDDLKETLEHLKRTKPKARIVATGISLGGIVLSRYLIHTGHNALVDAAMLISICWDLYAGRESLERPGLNYALNQHLARSLCNMVAENREVLSKIPNLNIDQVLKSKDIYEFDQNCTRKLWGYASAKDYHKDASNKGKICCIKKPTICVNAADDMFMPPEALPLEEFEESSHVGLVLTKYGGHIGFIEKAVPRLPFYTERLSMQFLAAFKKWDPREFH